MKKKTKRKKQRQKQKKKKKKKKKKRRAAPKRLHSPSKTKMRRRVQRVLPLALGGAVVAWRTAKAHVCAQHPQRSVQAAPPLLHAQRLLV